MGVLGSGLTGLGNVNTAGEPPGAGAGGGGGVTKIIAGDGISISPTTGVGHVTVNAIDALRLGADLTDADATWNPGSDQTSLRVLPAATLTTNRTLTLGVSGSPPIGTKAKIIRKDLTANTYAIVNGGPGGGTTTFPASPLTPQAEVFAFDGTNWNNVDPSYQAGGSYAAPTDPLFLSPLLWLRADLGVTPLVSGKCSQWLDQSGNGNHATQATADNRFTFNASSVNGKPGMTGTASTGMSLATGLFAAGAQRWLVAVVKATVGNGGTILCTRSAVPQWLAAAGTLGAGFSVYSDLATRTVDTNPAYAYNGAGHVVQLGSTVGAPIAVSIDGVAQGIVNSFGSSTNVANDSGGAATAQIGFDAAVPGVGFIGDLVEIIAGPGAISAANQFKVNAYLSNRYGIVLP